MIFGLSLAHILSIRRGLHQLATYVNAHECQRKHCKTGREITHPDETAARMDLFLGRAGIENQVRGVRERGLAFTGDPTSGFFMVTFTDGFPKLGGRSWRRHCGVMHRNQKAPALRDEASDARETGKEGGE